MIHKPSLPLTSDLFPYTYKDPKSLAPTIDPFTITTTTGFLPFHRPKVNLPDDFKPLQSLLKDMPVVLDDGSPGLLATYGLGDKVDKEGALPELTSKIDDLVTANGEVDLAAITAAFRDYSFLASAYLLEPCWKRWNEDPNGGYGLGRDTLPACIAAPMVKCADILNIPPFMAYAASYCLYNYSISDATSSSPIPPNYKSMSLIRAFERGLDATSSEAGFILTHIDMVAHTPGLISGTAKLLDHLSTLHQRDLQGATESSSHEDEAIIATSLNEILTAMTAIESSMSRMWTNSLPSQYISFRTFIFGITSQSMFPNGVQYIVPESLTTTLKNLPTNAFDQPVHFRGESGANDSIIPLLDSLLSIPFPSNPLTSILHEFRAYRPLPHRTFLTYVRERSELLDVRHILATTSFETRYLLLKLLNHIRSFRWRHWTFAREYIIRRTSHPTATGGSPIVRWLPNQLVAVMGLMTAVWEEFEGGKKPVDGADDVSSASSSVAAASAPEQVKMRKELEEMMEEVYEQREKLKSEVEKWCAEREG